MGLESQEFFQSFIKEYRVFLLDSTWGSVQKAKEFVNQSFWKPQSIEKVRSYYSNISVGDFVILKSRESSNSVMIHALGTVKTKNEEQLGVDWRIFDEKVSIQNEIIFDLPITFIAGDVKRQLFEDLRSERHIEILEDAIKNSYPINEDFNHHEAFLDLPVFAVSAYWNEDSREDEFLKNHLWQLSPQSKEEIPEHLVVGSILILTVYEQSMLDIRAFGTVLNVNTNNRSLSVRWKKVELSTDITHFKYLQEITQLDDSDKNLIVSKFYKVNREVLGIINSDVIKPSYDLFASKGKDKTSDIKTSVPTFFPLSAGIQQNLLNVEKIAKAYAEVIHQADLSTSQTSQEDRFFGIFGRWGRGKTHLWKRMEDYLDKTYKAQYEFLDFHAWKYQDTPAIWAYLYETLSSKYYQDHNYQQNNFISYIKKKTKDAFKSLKLNRYRDEGAYFSRFFVPILAVVISLIIILAIHLGGFYESLIGAIFQGVLKFGAIPSAVIAFFISLYKNLSKPTVSNAVDFLKLLSRKSFRDHLGLQHEIQKELRYLLETWTKKDLPKHIILFVDDIDRCSHEKIIDIVDSLRVMLNDDFIREKLIIIAAIDERQLSAAIQLKYEKTQPIMKEENQTLVNEYFDKLFLVGIKLENLRDDEKKQITRKYLEPITQVVEKSKSQSEDGLDERTETEQEPLGQVKIDQDHLGSGIQNQEINMSSFELSTSENEYLLQKGTELNSATPRSIRSFTFRYRLAKNLHYTLGLGEFSNQELADEILKGMNGETESVNKAAQLVNYYPEVKKNEN